MNKEEIENFEYWVNTNTEKGVCHIPDYICNEVLNLISKLQKENEELRNFNSYLSNSDIDYLEGENIKLQKENDTLKTTINKQSKDISEQLKELDKKDKVINLIAESWKQDDIRSVEEIKEYFYKKELQKELEKSNKRIDMCIDLLNGEGCLNFDTKQKKLDYIDKLIKLEEEDEKK